jgi:hypothetical protein
LAAPVGCIDQVERGTDQPASANDYHSHYLHHLSNAACHGGGRGGCNAHPLAMRPISGMKAEDASAVALLRRARYAVRVKPRPLHLRRSSSLGAPTQDDELGSHRHPGHWFRPTGGGPAASLRTSFGAALQIKEKRTPSARQQNYFLLVCLDRWSSEGGPVR